MRIEVDNAIFEANSGNTHIFLGKTMLSGVYVDLDDDYVFIPENDSQDYANVVVHLVEEGVIPETLKSYNPNAEPYCFIINSLCRAFRKELDDLKIEN